MILFRGAFIIMTSRDSAESTINIGRFYELPDGRIAFAFGWDAKSKNVRYRFDDDSGSHSVLSTELIDTWRPRLDLEDFPNARDPRLPYVFDLIWDVKTRSALVSLLVDKNLDNEEKEIWEIMLKQGITLTSDEQTTLDKGRAARRTRTPFGM
jgi:hypothetical protein